MSLLIIIVTFLVFALFGREDLIEVGFNGLIVWLIYSHLV